MTLVKQELASVHPEKPAKDGAEVRGGRTMEVVNPVSMLTVAEFSCATAAEVDRVLAEARNGQRAWAAMPAPERSKVLWRFGELVEAHHEELARLDVACTGKVIRDAIPEALRASRHARFWSGKADKLYGQELYDIEGRLSFTRREPLGVYVVILPWNAPTHAFMARSMPALACGNAVVVKPSELSPLSAVRLVELSLEAGLPPNVLTTVLGDGETGALLSEHPAADGISFTGSVNTGRAVAVAAAKSFKRVTLELGGKSPIIVFDDADVDSAARAAVMGVAVNAGQICAASTRLLVQEGISDRFLAEVRARLAAVRIGDPNDPDTFVGPIVCQRQFDKISEFLHEARSEGGQLSSDRSAFHPTKGLFISPTLIENVSDDSKVVTEEIFGPILTVQRFATEAEALEMANDSSFGLAAFVWTTDAGRLHRMLAALEAGAVHGNSTLVLDPSMPFGGYKDSGLGGAYGDEAIEGCTRLKRITIRYAEQPLPSSWEGI